MKLLVGLGNPGKEYEKTRHNMGGRVLDALKLDFHLEKKFQAEIYVKTGRDLSPTDKPFILCKPQTFMNNSGMAVRAVADYYKISPSDIIVIHDDKDLPLGTIRLRKKGSSGGHNGVQSIIDHLGTSSFTRLKIGVANELTEKNDTTQFVLDKFSKAEEKLLPKIILGAIEKLNLPIV